ncbi:MAG: hypothetical protein H6729_14135 [Deltaproteobacteria bacterium]|nr:hypothetical protein [Deltaproteobacteria bacterium]
MAKSAVSLPTSLAGSEVSLSGVGSIPFDKSGVTNNKAGKPKAKTSAKAKPVNVASDAFKKSSHIGEQVKVAAQGPKTGYEPEALERMQQVAEQQAQSGVREAQSAVGSVFPAAIEPDAEQSAVEAREDSGEESGVYGFNDKSEPERTGLARSNVNPSKPAERCSVIPPNPDFVPLIQGKLACSYASGSFYGPNIPGSRRAYIPTPFSNGDACSNTTMSGRRLQFAADDLPFSARHRYENVNTTIAEEDWNRMRDQITLARLNTGGLLDLSRALQGWNSMTA